MYLNVWLCPCLLAPVLVFERVGVCARVCVCIYKSLACGSRGGKLGYTVFKLGGRVDFKVDCRVRVRYVRSPRTLI